MDNQLHVEVTRLCSKLLDNAISPEEFQRLDEILGSSAEARQLYMSYVDLHDVMPEITVPMPLTTESPVRVTLPPAKSSKPAPILPIIIAVAATIVLAFVLFPDPAPTPHPATATDAPVNDYVATLRGSVDCTWSSSPLQLRDGARIPIGQYDLSEGQAEMVFDSGVSLLIEGPAALEITGPESALLTQGRIVFDDGDGAQPFRLSTKTATLVDIGTRYALSVTDDREDLHVFDGTVERSNQAQKSLIKKGEAVRYSEDATTESIELAADGFIHELSSNASTGELLAIEPFDYDRELNDADSGHGWDSEWRVIDRPTGETVPGKVTSGVFDVPKGNAITIRRDLSRPIDLGQDGVYYVSLEVTAKRPTFFFILRSLQGAKEPGVRFGMNGNTVTSHFQKLEERTAIPLVASETYRFVCKIVASADHNDQVFAHVTPRSAPATPFEPKTWTTATAEADSNGILTLANLHIGTRSVNRGACKIDNVRIGTSWAAVTGYQRD